MRINKLSLMGNPNLGIYSSTTNDITIIPVRTSREKVKNIKECLLSEVICTNIAGSSIIGVFVTGNSNGIIIPHIASDEEMMVIKSNVKSNIEKIKSKNTAFGNLILVNDYGAIASEKLMKEKKVVKKIENILGVELVQGEIAGLHYVGSLAVVTNKGAIVHPMLKDDEKNLIESILKVPVEVGTINGGIPFVSTGIIANDNGVLIGWPTTGPEILNISNTLFR